MELEDRPSFFKVLVGDFSQQLCIPHAFVKNFNGHVPRFCGLRGPCGNLWAVNLKVIKNRLVFHDGWQSFAKHHFLEIGDFLTFTLDGESIFDVIIYGKSYCEKNIEAAKNMIGDVVDRTMNTDIILGKRLAPDLVEETSIGPISSNPANLFFKTTFTRSLRYNLKIPARVVKAAGLMSNKTIILQDPSGKLWSIKLTETTRGQLRMKDWYKCCEENQISYGDTLIIEVVKHSVFQLHVHKVGAALDVVEETSTVPFSINPANPFFKTMFKRSMRYDLRIPNRIVRTAGPMSKTIVLKDPAERHWSIKLHETTMGRVRMEGWGKCCEENQISTGDTIVIEVVKHSVFQLHVYKAGATLDVETQS